MRSLPRVLLAALALTLTAACATTPALRRGQPAHTLLDEVSRALATDGYACGYNADKSFLTCGHERFVDMTLGYIPASNQLQIFTAVNRLEDDTLADDWRGDCTEVALRANEVNANYLPKITCEGDLLFFTFYAWVPETGLRDDDARALFEVLRSAIADTLVSNGMVKQDG